MKLGRGHPNVVQFLDFYKQKDRYLIVMEKSGSTLTKSFESLGRCATESETATIVAQLASALDLYHSKGVAHRDIKPTNVLCDEQASLSNVKLCDFGLGSEFPAKAPPSSCISNTPNGSCTSNVTPSPEFGSPVGTFAHMAPEQIRTLMVPTVRYGVKCDNWSLGIIAYWLLSRCKPYTLPGCQKPNCPRLCGKPCGECLFTFYHDTEQPTLQ